MAVFFMENCRMVGMAMKYYRITVTDKVDYKYSHFVAVENNEKLERLKNEFSELIHSILGYDISYTAVVEISFEEYMKAMKRRKIYAEENT